MNASRRVLFAVFLALLPSVARGDDPEPPLPLEDLPAALHREVAAYPDSAYRAGIEGRVVVRSLVSTDGQVERVVLADSNAVFDRSALAAARKWTFQPAQDPQGRPIRWWISIPFFFRVADTAGRVRSDSLWLDPFNATPAVVSGQREALLGPMRDATEVWLFRLDPELEADAKLLNPRSRFALRKIRGAARVEAASTCAQLGALLADVRTHTPPPQVRGEYEPRLGVRFVAGMEVLDVVVSFADEAIFLKAHGRLWAASAEPHWREWARLAHGAFPADPNFARYASHDPREF